MKLLVDNCLSHDIATGLRSAGYDAVHLREILPHATPDVSIVDTARQLDRIVVTSDTDFGSIITLSGSNRPSIITFRKEFSRIPARQLLLLLNNLPVHAASLMAGAIVSLGPGRTRVRLLSSLADDA